jgi:hypothetical protein
VAMKAGRIRILVPPKLELIVIGHINKLKLSHRLLNVAELDTGIGEIENIISYRLAFCLKKEKKRKNNVRYNMCLGVANARSRY